MSHAAVTGDPSPPPVSPPWSPSTKRLVASFVVVLLLLFLFRIRILLLPIVMSMVVAYILEPIVRFLHQKGRLPRNLALVLVYLVIISALVAIPVTTLPRFISEVNNLFNNVPRYVEQLGDFLSRPIHVGPYVIPLNELPLDQAYETLSDNLLNIVQTIGSRSFSLFGSVATATLSTVGWLLVILFVSFYMVKDHHQLSGSLVRIVPPDHQADMRRLAHEISLTWNAFLRGQVLLFLIMFVVVFLVATVLGLPNALLLGFISGLAEFVPNVGAVLAAIPAVLIALFQNEASWLGAQLGPFWFAVVVLGIYVLLQQLEGIFLVPRVIGRSLNLHPMFVFLAAIGGASFAGILGILLASPVLATLRVILMYIYNKLNDLPPFPEIQPPLAALQPALQPAELVVAEE